MINKKCYIVALLNLNCKKLHMIQMVQSRRQMLGSFINVLANVNILVAQYQSARNYQVSKQEFVQISLNFEMLNNKDD